MATKSTPAHLVDTHSPLLDWLEAGDWQTHPASAKVSQTTLAGGGRGEGSISGSARSRTRVACARWGSTCADAKGVSEKQDTALVAQQQLKQSRARNNANGSANKGPRALTKSDYYNYQGISNNRRILPTITLSHNSAVAWMGLYIRSAYVVEAGNGELRTQWHSVEERVLRTRHCNLDTAWMCGVLRSIAGPSALSMHTV